MNWTVYKKDEKSAGVLALDDGLRLKYAEDPDSPGNEAVETFGARLKDISIIITAPCSRETIEALAAKAPKLKKIFVADENPERLRLWEESLRPSGIPCESILTDDTLEKTIYEKLTGFPVDMMRGRSAVYIPARFRRLENAFASALEQAVLSAQIRFCSSAAHKTTRSWHVIMTYIVNTLFMEKKVYSLPEGFTAESVTIVGAGPSLNDNIEMLSKYQDRTFIIACDSALNALIEHGITPDIAMSSEDASTSWRFFAKHPEAFNDINLAIPLSGNSVIIRNYRGRIIFTAEEEVPQFFREFKDSVITVERGQCVGHYAFNMAMKLKPREIIMTGFDLALKNGEYHCKSMGSPYYKDNPSVFSLIDIKGNDGSMLKTETALLIYLRQFEELVEACGIRVINATEGGAFIEGTVLMTLEEALKDKPPKTSLQPVENTRFAGIGKTAYLERLGKGLEEAGTLIEKARSDAEKMTPEKFKNPFSGMPLESPVFELISGISSFLQITELIEAIGSIEATGFEEFMKISRENLAEFMGGVDFLKELLESANAKRGKNYLVLNTPGVDRTKIPGLPSGAHFIESDAGLQLFEIWRLARESDVGTLIAFNGHVIPDAWGLRDLKCIDLRTLPVTESPARYLWIPGYSVAGADEKITEEWRKLLPPDVNCDTIGEIFN